MKHSTPETMKFKKLARRLGVNRCQVVGILELLWIATQKDAKRGDIGKFSNEEIAIECDWEGDPDELVDALVDTGWLDRCDTHRLVVHDWKDHAPRYIHAWVKSQSTGFAIAATAEATVEATTEATTGGGIPNQTKPNQTIRNQTKPKEESKDSSCSELRHSEPSEPPLMEFPVNGPTKRWSLTKSRVDQYRELYPFVSIPAECKKAKQWLVDNPKRRKTAQGMPRFLTGWLCKANDRQSRQSERDAVIAANNAHKPKPITAESARYSLVKTFGIKEARDWSDNDVIDRYLVAIAEAKENG